MGVIDEFLREAYAELAAEKDGAAAAAKVTTKMAKVAKDEGGLANFSQNFSQLSDCNNETLASLAGLATGEDVEASRAYNKAKGQDIDIYISKSVAYDCWKEAEDFCRGEKSEIEDGEPAKAAKPVKVDEDLTLSWWEKPVDGWREGRLELHNFVTGKTTVIRLRPQRKEPRN